MRAGWALAVVLQHVLALSPLMILAAMYGASWRTQAIIGHWPRLMLDDPKFIVDDDLLCTLLYCSVRQFMALACYGLPVFVGLTVGGEHWQVRVNAFPQEEHRYSLIVNGVVVDEFQGWPAAWTRPSPAQTQNIEPSGGVWWKSVRELHHAIKAKNAADLAEAERRGAEIGMEPFSLARLEELLGAVPGSRARREEWLRTSYYIPCLFGDQGIKTLAGFAKHIRELEEWE